MDEQLLSELDRAKRDFECDRFERALVRYNKILVRAPASVSARIGRARSLTCLRKAGPASDALATIDLIKRVEFRAEYEVASGDLAILKNQPSEAEQHYRAALAIDPGSIDASIGLAESLHRQNKEPESDQIVTELLASKPQSAQVLGAYAVSLAQRGRTADALRSCLAALRIKPTRSLLAFTLRVLNNLLMPFGVIVILAAVAAALLPRGPVGTMVSTLASLYMIVGWTCLFWLERRQLRAVVGAVCVAMYWLIANRP